MKQASASELLENQIIELSFKDSQDEPYPNPNQSLIRDDTRPKPISSVKRSSFNLEDSYGENSMEGLSESFSALNGSLRDEHTFKSKLRTNRSEIRNEPEYSPSEKELWEFNQSIFTDRAGNQVVGLNRRSSDKEKEKEKEQEAQYQHQPFQMKSNLPVPVSPVTKPPKAEFSSDFKVILRSTNYFLEKSNGNSVMVNGEMLRDLYDEFFKQELFVPLFKYERFDEWNHAKDKFNADLEAHRIFRVALQKYIEYITKKYPAQFDHVFKVLEEIQRGKVAKKREQNAFTFLHFDLASIMESLKQYISSPKTEILRKTLLSKIRVVQEVLKTVQTQADLMQEQAQRTLGKVDPKTAQGEAELQQQAIKLRERLEGLWEQFGEVQLLLNFEETEYYCSKKIQNSPQLKFREIWIKYRDAMRAQKGHHTQQNLRAILI